MSLSELRARQLLLQQRRQQQQQQQQQAQGAAPAAGATYGLVSPPVPVPPLSTGPPSPVLPVSPPAAVSPSLLLRQRSGEAPASELPPTQVAQADAKRTRTADPATPAASASPAPPLQVSALLQHKSVRERQAADSRQELEQLLAQPTLREQLRAAPFQQHKDTLRNACPQRTLYSCLQRRSEQRRQRAQQLGLFDVRHPSYPPMAACAHIHFQEVIRPGITRRELGECSYLNACQSRNCRKVHYEIVQADLNKIRQQQQEEQREREDKKRKREQEGGREEEGWLGATAASAFALAASSSPALSVSSSSSPSPPPLPSTTLRPPEWLRCDIRTVDVSVLGEFSVVMMDPPWRIHMHLPYHTMSDEEMLDMNIEPLQKEGVCFVWVIARAVDLGRRCLQRWGYRLGGELLWVKVDQLTRLRRTGRTGHYLNHSSERCLIGIKGNPTLNRNLDCDVIVAPVRETSRKPDEVYGMLERLAPGQRKLELFGRQHNTRPNWLTIGNQLDGLCVHDPELKARIEQRYGAAALQANWLGPRPPGEEEEGEKNGNTA